MIHVLFDNNVVVDWAASRSPWNIEADALIEAHRDGPLQVVVAATTLTTLFYLPRKPLTTPGARQAITGMLRDFVIAPITVDTLRLADTLTGPDLEDNVLIAAAIEQRLDGIVTRDRAGFSASPVRVYTPGELLAEIGRTPRR